MSNYDFYRAVAEGKIKGILTSGDRFEIDLNVVLKEHLELKARVAELEGLLSEAYFHMQAYENVLDNEGWLLSSDELVFMNKIKQFKRDDNNG